MSVGKHFGTADNINFGGYATSTEPQGMVSRICYFSQPPEELRMRSNWGCHDFVQLDARINLAFLIQPDDHTLKNLIKLTVISQSWGC